MYTQHTISLKKIEKTSLNFPNSPPPPPPPPHPPPPPPHRPGALINPQWLELPMSRIHFHSPKDVRAFEVRLYVIRTETFGPRRCMLVGGASGQTFLFVYTINYVQYAEYRFTCNEQQRLRSHLGDVSSICGSRQAKRSLWLNADSEDPDQTALSAYRLVVYCRMYQRRSKVLV